MKALHVRWVDSATINEGTWTSVDDLPDEQVVCENVGFLVKANDHSIWVAGKYATNEVGSVDQIPRVAITYLKELDLDGEVVELCSKEVAEVTVRRPEPQLSRAGQVARCECEGPCGAGCEGRSDV